MEERLEQLIQQVKASPEVILFIDELHVIMGDGGSGAVLANVLKPVLARGDFPCIGATTIAEYRRYIEKDAALSRRFEVIMVPEPALDVCVQIAKAHGEHIEAKIPEGAIEAAVHLSACYLPDERLPAKAIKLLDEAAAYIKLPSFLPGGAETEADNGQSSLRCRQRQLLFPSTTTIITHLSRMFPLRKKGRFNHTTCRRMEPLQRSEKGGMERQVVYVATRFCPPSSRQPGSDGSGHQTQGSRYDGTMRFQSSPKVIARAASKIALYEKGVILFRNSGVAYCG